MRRITLRWKHGALPVPIADYAAARGEGAGATCRNSHLGKRIPHGVHRVAHFVGADRADAADAERLDLSELARIEDEALVAHAIVELLRMRTAGSAGAWKVTMIGA